MGRRLFIGLDEAGYGPLLGPLCLGASVFRVEAEQFPAARIPRIPALREALRELICHAGRAATAEALPVPVDDSKLLHGRHGLRGLSRAFGCFTSAMAQPPPADLADLIQRFSDRVPEAYGAVPWFDGLGEVELPAYPWTGPLDARFDEAGVEALDLRVLPIDVAEYNRDVRRFDNKARALGFHLASLLVSVLEQTPGEDATVVIDRQGGRKAYDAWLRACFPFAEVLGAPSDETTFCYEVRLPDRRLEVAFLTGGDGRSLAIGWASVAAKLTRELFMEAFNDWFLRARPMLRPTAGYVTDGRRFLADVGDLIEARAIDRELLVRIR